MDAEVLATLILRGFEDYRHEFKGITLKAKERFEDANWPEVQRASRERIELYDKSTADIVSKVGSQLDPAKFPLRDWQKVKNNFEVLISEHAEFDLAQTVFNTVFRKLYGGRELNDEHAFVTSPFPSDPRFDADLYLNFAPSQSLEHLFRQILDSYPFTTDYRDLDGDISKIIQTMKASIPLLRFPRMVSFEMLKTVFYRNKGVYLIGRMMIGEHLFPVAIPILNDDEGLYVDTVIWNESDLSLIFSFTRSYFMADIDYPCEMVRFLQEILPNKKRSELYASLGFYKHGKTEFYRGFLHHLASSDDQFVIAEGIKGLVMTVFTLPSYQVVFKMIKDKFSPTKRVTRQQVKDRYYLVKTHDRVGRMADTQEFSNFVFPRERFSPDLIAELLKLAGSSVELTDDKVILKHLYMERLMIPLNLYIEGKSDYILTQALDEYGNAIKQLAAANIFPGDMLLKNFGVTRHGRVVFYDYDEICYLTDVNFRKIPQPRYPEDEMAAEPWYSVGPRDVFPEEFRTFLFNSDKLKEIFARLHGEIYDAEYWQELQKAILEEQVTDVFPYRRKKRFDQRASI